MRNQQNQLWTGRAIINGMNKTVLVVDDDKLIRKGLDEALSNVGLKVETAVDGREGLTKALKLHPDLIVTDIRMPELDGIQMIDRLRTDNWGKQVPVIVLSNDETTNSVNQALVAGVTVYLAKDHLDPDTIAQQIVSSLPQ